MVIIDIDNIVPTENNIKNNIPVNMLGVVGKIASITAALPAMPWISPITNDLGLKKGKRVKFRYEPKGSAGKVPNYNFEITTGLSVKPSHKSIK